MLQCRTQRTSSQYRARIRELLVAALSRYRLPDHEESVNIFVRSSSLPMCQRLHLPSSSHDNRSHHTARFLSYDSQFLREATTAQLSVIFPYLMKELCILATRNASGKAEGETDLPLVVRTSLVLRNSASRHVILYQKEHACMSAFSLRLFESEYRDGYWKAAPRISSR
jgi:hypothetical protein